jgi:glycosyltransferase involved in cell wall biosynthesis
MFGIVFAEAMAAGLPIVSTTCTAIPEVVTPDAGKLLSLNARAHSFAQEIHRIASDQETWRSMSANAFRRAQRFRWERAIQGYAEVCAEVVGE